MNLVQRLIRRAARIPSERDTMDDFARALGLPGFQGFANFARGNGPLTAMLSKAMAAINTDNRAWINASHAEQYPTSVPVYTAVKLRADATARAPLRVFRPNRQGELEPMDDDFPVQRLLDRVNPWWTQADMWRAIETYLNLYGQAFVTIERNESSDLDDWELWVQHPTRMQVVVDKRPGRANNYIAGFIHDPDLTKTPMKPEDVIWWKYFNPLNEFAGLSPIAPGRLSIDMQRDMLKTNAAHFKNGILVQNLVFMLKEPLLNTDKIDEFYDRLQERHGGPENAGKPIISDLGEGSVSSLGLSNREMEWMAGLHFSLEEVGRIFRVPPPLMYNQERAIYANVAAATEDFYQNTITQEWNLLRATLQERLIPALPEAFRDVVLGFDVSMVEALQVNRFQNVASLAMLLDRGVITINEVAVDLGYKPKPWGDTWHQPFGLIPVDRATPSPREPAAPSDNDDDGGDDDRAIAARIVHDALNTPPTERRALIGYVPQRDMAPHNLFYTPNRRARLGEAQEERAVGSFLRQLAQNIPGFEQMQRNIFGAQRDGVLRAIARQRAAPINAMSVFKSEEWLEVMRVEGNSVYGRILSGNAEAQVSEFALGIDFDLARPTAQAWMDERIEFWSERTNNETSRLLVNTLEEGNLAGDGIAAMQARVEEVFDFNDEVRAEAIARTETTAASNQGHLEAYTQAGVDDKTWLTTIDGRERIAHRQAHRQTVPIQSPFLVGGEAMMAPGQGSAANIVNCRCTTVPSLR